jgi:CRISPR-associated protein Csh1
MGLNAKKPYLEHKTRTLNIPFMIENENALLVKKFFDWLKLQPYNQDRTLDEEHFFIQKQSQNDEAEITEFDYIPVLQDDINKNFEVIEVKNYLKIKKDKQIVQDYEIKKLETLEEKVNELFYNGQLKYSYYRDGKDIKVSSFVSKELQTLLYQTKYAMLNYFKKYDDSGFYKNIKQYGTAFVLNHLRQGWELKAKEALNLKFALLEHYSKEHTVNIEAVLETLNKRLEEEGNYSSLSKEEFLFLSGQWAYYLLWYSKARDRTFALAEKYFRVKNLAALKTALQSDLDKYSHAINREAKRVKKTLALISAYDGLEAVTSSDLDLFLAGFSVDNIIFSKKNEEK